MEDIEQRQREPEGQGRTFEPGAAAVVRDDQVAVGAHLADVLAMHRLMRREGAVVEERESEQHGAAGREERLQDRI